MAIEQGEWPICTIFHDSIRSPVLFMILRNNAESISNTIVKIVSGVLIIVVYIKRYFSELLWICGAVYF